MARIRVGIAGVGNCASALVQGVTFYNPEYRLDNNPKESLEDEVEPASENAGLSDELGKAVGLMHPNVGGFRPHEIEFVAAFDVDERKVGRPLEEAVFAEPNCATVFQETLPATGVVVKRGPLLDGVADHMTDYPDDQAFRVGDVPEVDVAAELRANGAEVLVCFLPVGSQAAVECYAEACLEAGVAFVNCIPVFIASNPSWADRFRKAGLPIVGDDIKSQVGATIVHRTLARLFADRGVEIDRTYQLNTGGNTDFLNMLERKRLRSKKISKTESVQSQLGTRLSSDNIHVGPSDYVPWQKDNKVAFIRAEGRAFGDVPIELELRLSVQDSPNSAGVVIDAIRCARLGLDRGIGGPLDSACAYYMKSPPVQMRDEDARVLLDQFIEAKPLETNAVST